ncbi:MAG: HdeD family acid-resistance protein [Candidatus Berkiella sp.]
MSIDMMMKNFDKQSFGKNWGWFLAWGLLLLCLGFIAIGAAALTTLLSVIFLGVLFVLGGAVLIIDSVHFWRGKGKAFFINLLMGLLYLAFGIMLIINPLVGAATLTLVLAVLFVLLGLSRVIYALAMRFPQWGWMLISGILTLTLGILVAVGWPQSSLFIIGIFVGIDLIFGGWAYIMAAIVAKSLNKSA